MKKSSSFGGDLDMTLFEVKVKVEARSERSFVEGGARFPKSTPFNVGFDGSTEFSPNGDLSLRHLKLVQSMILKVERPLLI